jgi:hypothetical protein
MRYRSTVILARWTLGAGAQTKPVPITLSQPISRLAVNIELVNSSYVWVDHPAKVLKGMEVVDGSDVLFSMDGGAAHGLEFYGTKRQPYLLNNGFNLDSSRACYTADFGRFLWDPVYGLDPAHHTNLELKLELDRSLGACSPGSAYVTVVADVFDEFIPSLIGFMQSKEVKEYFPTDDLTEYTELPRDFPYRFLMIKACAEEEGAIVQCEDFKLSEDHDKHVLIDERTEQYLERVASDWPVWTEYFGVRGLNAGQSFYISPTHGQKPVGLNESYADGYFGIAWAGGQLLVAKNSIGGDIAGWASGYCPNGCIPIRFGDMNNPEDFFRVDHLKSLNLKLHTRATDACDQTDTRTKIIVQQVRPY